MTITPSKTSQAILAALQPNSKAGRNAKHVYGGTVPANVNARRRAASKVAAASRRQNRGR